MKNDEVACYTTCFIALDPADIDGFLDLSFRSLKREATKTIDEPGTYSITVTINSLKTSEVKAQALQIDEAA